MSTNVPEFQSFFRVFFHHFLLAKLASSSIRVNIDTEKNKYKVKLTLSGQGILKSGNGCDSFIQEVYGLRNRTVPQSLNSSSVPEVGKVMGWLCTSSWDLWLGVAVFLFSFEY